MKHEIKEGEKRIANLAKIINFPQLKLICGTPEFARELQILLSMSATLILYSGLLLLSFPPLTLTPSQVYNVPEFGSSNI